MSYHDPHLLPPTHREDDYEDPSIPDNRVFDEEHSDLLKDLHGPRYCLVGNIRQEKENNPDWEGPELFNRGQKIYLVLVKDERIVALGRHRQKNAYINTWLNLAHTENWRIQTIYKKIVLRHTSDYYFKGTTLAQVRDALNSKGRFP